MRKQTECEKNNKSDVGLWLFRLHCSIRNRRNQDFDNYGLTGIQADILVYLLSKHKEHDIYQVDIEHQFKLTNPTVTGILQRMEMKGFVERIPSQTDKRCKCIIATQKAIDVYQQIEKMKHQCNEDMIRGFSETELEQLQGYLQRLYENIAGGKHD